MRPNPPPQAKPCECDTYCRSASIRDAPPPRGFYCRQKAANPPTPSTRRAPWFNWPVFVLGFAFWFMETRHFGWNLTAQSEGEIICDGIAMLIQALAFIGWRGKR